MIILAQAFSPGTSVEPAVIPTAQAWSLLLLLMLLLLLLLLLYDYLVTGLFSQYFSWTSGDPHRSDIKFIIIIIIIIDSFFHLHCFCISFV